MIQNFLKSVSIFLVLLPAFVKAGDIFVFASTHKNHSDAQKVAAIKGGWVLNTNFYDELTPNLFSVVRGPYKNWHEAKEILALVNEDGSHPSSYIKDAGDINIDLEVGNRLVSPQMLAALLGELRIDVNEYPGGSEPCEPDEPYKQVSLVFITVTQHYNEKNDTVFYKWKNIEPDIGIFREISSTGEIDRMRICAE